MKTDWEVSAILDLIELDIRDNNPYCCGVCKRHYKTASGCYRHIDTTHDFEVRSQMNKFISPETNNQEVSK